MISAPSAAERCGFIREPLVPKCFVGRGGAVHEVLELAFGRRAPLVNLVGPGKIGRTSFLQFVQHLSRTRGRGTTYGGLFEESGLHLVVPYVDIGATSGNASIRSTVADAIAREMQKHELSVPEHQYLEGHGALEVLSRHMNDAKNVRYLLEVDGAEYIPVSDYERAEYPQLSGAESILATLNNYVDQFGIIFSFGVGGPVNSLDVEDRREREQRFLESTSRLLNLIEERVDLWPLKRAEVEQFARRALESQSNGNSNSLAKDVEWIADVSGGHPFVLQTAGILLEEMRATEESISTEDYDLIERRVVEKLITFVGGALRRLSRQESSIALGRRLAANPDKSEIVSRHVAAALVGEGLAEAKPLEDVEDSPYRVQMLSRALGAALLARAKTRPSDEVTNRPSAPVSPFALSVATAKGDVEIPITDVESRLFRILLRASLSGGLVSSDSLRTKVLGAKATDQHLKQRLSVLRKKIETRIGKDQAIKNVYNKGYCVVGPTRFQLSGK